MSPKTYLPNVLTNEICKSCTFGIFNSNIVVCSNFLLSYIPNVCYVDDGFWMLRAFKLNMLFFLKMNCEVPCSYYYLSSNKDVNFNFFMSFTTIVLPKCLEHFNWIILLKWTTFYYKHCCFVLMVQKVK